MNPLRPERLPSGASFFARGDSVPGEQMRTFTRFLFNLNTSFHA